MRTRRFRVPPIRARALQGRRIPSNRDGATENPEFEEMLEQTFGSLVMTATAGFVLGEREILQVRHR
jgi:hypothetical protein